MDPKITRSRGRPSGALNHPSRPDTSTRRELSALEHVSQEPNTNHRRGGMDDRGCRGSRGGRGGAAAVVAVEGRDGSRNGGGSSSHGAVQSIPASMVGIIEF
jgi:hypothetical protein